MAFTMDEITKRFMKQQQQPQSACAFPNSYMIRYTANGLKGSTSEQAQNINDSIDSPAPDEASRGTNSRSSQKSGGTEKNLNRSSSSSSVGQASRARGNTPIRTPSGSSALKQATRNPRRPLKFEEFQLTLLSPVESNTSKAQHKETNAENRTSTPLSRIPDLKLRLPSRDNQTPSKGDSQQQNPLKGGILAPVSSENSRSSENLKLHFRYCKQYFPDSSVAKPQPDLPPVTASATSVSSVEDFEMVYRCKNTTNPIKILDKLDFTKFIPVPIPVPLFVPKLLLNKMDPKEWEEAQAAFLEDRVQDQKESISDTSIDKTKKQVLPNTPNKSVKCIPIKFKSFRKSRKSGKRVDELKRGTTGLENLSFDAVKYLRPGTPTPKRLDPRFDLDKAEDLVKINTAVQPNFNATLYAALPENPNNALCHTMTELAVSAMLNFFHPYRDVQCLWIKDIQSKLIDLLKDHSLKPKFTRLVYLRKFEAILVLSEDAGQLLRHKNMCFLHSLASALRVSAHKLLVLVRDGKAFEDAQFRPFTA